MSEGTERGASIKGQDGATLGMRLHMLATHSNADGMTRIFDSLSRSAQSGALRMTCELSMPFDPEDDDALFGCDLKCNFESVRLTKRKTKKRPSYLRPV